jgi:hypothetical protein
MSERYVDRFLKCVSQDRQSQGLYVKLPGVSMFLPVIDVKEIPKEPDMLLITVPGDDARPYPEGPSRACYFAHKSQVVFRTQEFMKS